MTDMQAEMAVIQNVIQILAKLPNDAARRRVLAYARQPELAAIQQMGEALRKLPDDAKARVLTYVRQVAPQPKAAAPTP